VLTRGETALAIVQEATDRTASFLLRIDAKAGARVITPDDAQR
jgi:hypothetical protein